MGLSHPLLLDRLASLLVVVDIQGRLAAAMPPAARNEVIGRTSLLLRAAALLDVPVIATEQYPNGLGPTEEAVASSLPDGAPVLEKTCFACTGAEGFLNRLSREGRSQIILTGMETHVCVLQTAFELFHAGFSVFVVADAVCSRDARNRDNALQRMREAGVIITNSESTLFEWLRDARHEHFKTVSALLK